MYHMANFTSILDAKNFPYLSQDEIKKINEGFQLLNIPVTYDYPGALEFTKLFEKPSILTSEGIQYTLSGSSSNPLLTK